MSFLSVIAMLCLGAEPTAPWPRHTVDDSSRGADGVRLADVNGDGLADIATGWEEGGRVRVYLNPGPELSKAPWPAVTVGKVKSPEDAVFADLDGDGQVDVISSCEGKTRSLFVHWAPKNSQDYLEESAWETVKLTAAPGGQLWMFVLPLQIDGKRGVDLVAGSKGAKAKIGWLQSPEDPRDLRNWNWRPLYDASWIMSLRAYDMDGDGDLDVLASDRKGKKSSCLWLEYPGAAKAQESWNVRHIGPRGKEYMFLDYGDVNNDGIRDVAAAVRNDNIQLFTANADSGDRTWTRSTVPMPKGYGQGKAVAVGDIDLDGRNDLVFTCGSANKDLNGVGWFQAGGDRTSIKWTLHPISGPHGVKYDRIELIDLDGDGDLDVLTCEERSNLGVIWYENPSR